MTKHKNTPKILPPTEYKQKFDELHLLYIKATDGKTVKPEQDKNWEIYWEAKKSLEQFTIKLN